MLNIDFYEKNVHEKIWKFYLQKTELWYVHVEDSMWKEDAASSEVKGCAWCASELGYVQKEDGWQVRWKLPLRDVLCQLRIVCC